MFAPVLLHTVYTRTVQNATPNVVQCAHSNCTKKGCTVSQQPLHNPCTPQCCCYTCYLILFLSLALLAIASGAAHRFQVFRSSTRRAHCDLVAQSQPFFYGLGLDLWGCFRFSCSSHCCSHCYHIRGPSERNCCYNERPLPNGANAQTRTGML